MRQRLLIAMLLISVLSFANFRFVQITDTHGGRHEPGNRALAGLVEDILKLDPRPDFVISTGDFIETGLDWEYDKYLSIIAPLEAAQIPVYHVLGNHESRWAARIKKDFTDRFGPTYQHLEHKGHHFFLLDTSLVPEAYGHLESSQLEWLERELEKIGASAPVWAFSHHPLGFGARYTDNDWEAVDRLLPYNFVLGMFGHGHSNRRWQIEGREFFMCRAGSAGSYAFVDVGAEEAEVFYKQVGSAPSSAFKVSIKKPQRENVKFSSVYPASLLEGTAFPLTVTASAELDAVEVRLGTEQWQKLKYKDGAWEGEVVPKFVGIQTLLIRGRSGDEIYQTIKEVRVAPLQQEGLPQTLWAYKTGGSIFSSPIVDDKHVYVGSHDGKFYALDKITGEPIWIYPIGEPILSSPVVDDDAVYFAGGDGYLYCLEKKLGTKKWSTALGDPIIASPAIYQGRLYLGGPAGFFCLDQETGKLLWEYESPELVKVKPAFWEGKVYFTSWSRYVTCLDAKTGKLVWEREIDRSFYYAPATGNPVVYEGQLIITTPKNIVLSLDLNTGEELWRRENIKVGYSSPTIWQERLLLTTLDGLIVALDPKDGKEIWKTNSGDNIYDAKIATWGELGISNTARGNLVAFDLKTGKLLWKKQLTDSFIFSAPYLSHGVVYVGGIDDQLYAVKCK